MMIAEALANQPGQTIPALFTRKYDIDAAYAFFDRPQATPDVIQCGHRDLVKEQLRQPSPGAGSPRGLLPGAPTDPDVRITRIGLVASWIRCPSHDPPTSR